MSPKVPAKSLAPSCNPCFNLFTFVFNWNEYLFALYLTQADAVTLPIQIAKMVDAYTVLWGTISASVVMQLVPMVVVVFLLQRHMIRGLALGAVK